MYPALYVLAAYLMGSLPSAYLYTRLLGGGRDIRAVGSGNVGGMNTFRNVSKVAGALTGVTDLGKGLFAVWLAGRLFDVNTAVMGATAVAVVAGHNWMPWMQFRGGKGIGASAGGLLILLPWSLVPVILAYAGSILVLRDSYASVAFGFATLPVAMYFLGGRSLLHFAVGLGIAVVVIAKHLPELGNYIRRRRRIA